MWWTVAKEAANNWSSHKDARQGAAFSLGLIIVIAVAILPPPCLFLPVAVFLPTVLRRALD